MGLAEALDSLSFSKIDILIKLTEVQDPPAGIFIFKMKNELQNCPIATGWETK